jgi:hypothetical protein
VKIRSGKYIKIGRDAYTNSVCNVVSNVFTLLLSVSIHCCLCGLSIACMSMNTI